ncbi:C39 family peptidase [Thermoanaerobacterium thermosaccharolyticum]|uniref:C39 family peptidase n=1 Tax=Thermoanaerobacterium thermosaccharolyticum TaxID=1517 RepID=UPI003DA7E5F6
MIWNGEKISERINLYNSDDQLSAYLYNILHGNKIIGYVIVDPKTDKVVEYALGQSPYSDYLSEYIKAKSDKFNNKKITLLYDGPSNYVVAAGDEKSKSKEIFDFTYDSSVKLSVDTSKDAKNLLKTKNITTNVTTLSSGKILYNVGTEQVVGNRSCGPVAAYNLLYFWAHNGYPKLLITGNADNDIAQLAKDMGTTVGATPFLWYKNGLNQYTNRVYYGQFYTGDLVTSYDSIKNEINNNRPGTVLYLLHPYYGSHYVVFMGYTTNYWYVVHDGWNTNDVYRDFNYDKSYISNLAYTIWGM